MAYLSKEGVLLSLQKSLIGYIKSDLRAVILHYSSLRIVIRFVLDHVPSIDDEDFYSEALLDFYSDIITGKDPLIEEKIYHQNS